MPPPAPHNPLLDKLDITPLNKPFKRTGYKSALRRNKNLKQILSDPSRAGTGTTTPTATDPARLAPPAPTAVVPTAAAVTVVVGPTYANIESAPSFVRGKKWCDVTGLPAKYTDPKTKLRYADGEVYQALRSLPVGASERYLEVRGANVILK